MEMGAPGGNTGQQCCLNPPFPVSTSEHAITELCDTPPPHTPVSCPLRLLTHAPSEPALTRLPSYPVLVPWGPELSWIPPTLESLPERCERLRVSCLRAIWERAGPFLAQHTCAQGHPGDASVLAGFQTAPRQAAWDG